MTADVYRFDDFEVDRAAFELRHEGKAQPVEPQALDLLLCLLAADGELVSREELFREALGVEFASEDALFKAVQRARQALGDDGRRQRYIKTVPGRGYRFAQPIALSEGLVPTGAEEDRPADGLPPSPKSSRLLRKNSFPGWPLAAAGTLAITSLALLVFWNRGPSADLGGRRAGDGRTGLGVGLEELSPEQLEQLIAALPASAEVARSTHAGWRRLQILHFEEAAAAFEAALDSEPGYLQAWHGLTRARLEQGDLTGAREAASSAREQVADQRDPSRPVVLLTEALFEEAHGRLAEAETRYRALWSFDESELDYGLAVARCRVLRGEPGAQAVLEKVAALLDERDERSAGLELRLLVLQAGAHRNAGAAEELLIVAARIQELAAAEEWRQAHLHGLLLEGAGHQLKANVTAAQRAYEEAETLADGVSPWGRRRARLGLAQLLAAEQRYDEAGGAFSELMAEADRTADSVLEARILNHLGRIDLVQRDLESSLRRSAAALDLARAVGDLALQASALHSQGDALADQTQFEKARRAYDAARQLYGRLGNRRGDAGIRGSLGLVYRMDGNPRAARQELEGAAQIYRELELPLEESLVLYNLASVNVDRCWLDDAALQLERSLELESAAESDGGRAWALHGLALVEFERNALAQALEHIDQAIALRRRLGDRAAVVSSTLRRALLLGFTDRPQEALESIDLVLGQDLEKPSETRVLALHLRSIALLRLGRLDEADRSLDQADELQEEIGVSMAVHRGALFRGEVALQRRDLVGARQAFETARDATAEGLDPIVRLGAEHFLHEVERLEAGGVSAGLLERGRALLEESRRLGCRRPAEQIRSWLERYG